MRKKLTLAAILAAAGVFGLAFAIVSLSSQPVATAGNSITGDTCNDLPSHAELTEALESVVDVGNQDTNAGLANDMWASIVNRDGEVCAVTFSGDDRGDQWPGSRVISAQKANTANAFSLPDGSGGIVPGLALSTANLYSAVQPGGSLFGLQESNPVDTDVAYGGNANNYGQQNDPMVGERIGGVNVFGGGTALYNEDGELLGALGVSGDSSCTDHIVAWKVRDALGLDFVPAGVSPTGDDNIIFDTTLDPTTGHTVSAGGFGHPTCGFGDEVGIAEDLPSTHPIGPNP
ncbi:MAG: heme-binding protein [Chloroflexi bacterium]|nr:heme-binding protein [Chloroflexota bacterium]